MRTRHTLWTRDFTLITLGTVISSIGGVALNFALSLVVFDQTSSTLLSSLVMVCSMLPGTLVPVLAAPLVDRWDRKKLIVGLDYFSGALMLLVAFWSARGFSYGLYLGFSLVSGCVSAVYSLAYDALYPDLIPPGFAQKGYSVSSLIYPSVTALFTPLASVVYMAWGIEVIFAAEGLALLGAATFECFIRSPHTVQPAQGGTLRARLAAYKSDLFAGVRYLKGEKGILGIYSYMAVTNASATGVGLMTMAHFQSTPGLGAGLYSLLLSAETVGRTVGGVVHYLFKIPPKTRYRLTVTVYQLYEACDAALLFLAWPLMLAVRFLCGFMGVNTATLRTAAVQNYLPPDMRARVNALFSRSSAWLRSCSSCLPARWAKCCPIAGST